jgi:uncharacterized cofD-like protein
MKKSQRKNIVVIGGGTGTFSILTGLKAYPFNLTAIVAMTDSGGSTGQLRDELGVLPPGDVIRCLLALSTQDKLMRTLMLYRFESGALKGHRFGNLLLSALEKATGSFQVAVERASDILRTNGRVIPSTLDQVHLMAKVGKRIIRGEEKIQTTKMNGALEYMWLEPVARANPRALAAIKEADAIILGPGGFYSSIITNLLVRGISDAIRKSKAKKIFMCNLMTKSEHTDGYSVANYTSTLEQYLGGPVETVIYNSKQPPAAVLKRYQREGDTLTSWDNLPKDRELIGGDLISRQDTELKKIGTPAKETSLVRHDSSKIAKIIAEMFDVKKVAKK